MKRELVRRTPFGGDYVQDAIDAMGKCDRFTEGMNYEDFINDDKTVFAVIRALEVIGEAVKNIPEDVRTRYPEIPWKEVHPVKYVYNFL